MAYDEKLADQIRDQFKGKGRITEKKMFGGLCFMMNGNMTCGVEKDNLVVRVGPDQYDWALKQKHTRPMDFTGRPLKGFVYVLPQGIKTPSSLKKWLDLATDFVNSLPSKLN